MERDDKARDKSTRNQILATEYQALKALIGKLSNPLHHLLAQNECMNDVGFPLNQLIRDVHAGRRIEFAYNSLVQQWHGQEGMQAFHKQILLQLYNETCRARHQDVLLAPASDSLFELIERELLARRQEPDELTHVPGVGFVSNSDLASLVRTLANDFEGLQSTSMVDIMEPMNPMAENFDSRFKAMCESVAAYVASSHRTQTSSEIWESPHESSVPPPSRLLAGFTTFQVQQPPEYNNQAMPVPPGTGPMATSHEAPSSSQRMSSILDPLVLTLYVRNVPARFTPENLLRIWNPQDSYNLLYMPYSHGLGQMAGCAIINFISHDAAAAFYQRWNGTLLTDSGRRLSINPASTQGLARNLWGMKYSKKIMRTRNRRYTPLLLLPDGSIADFHRIVENMNRPGDWSDSFFS